MKTSKIGSRLYSFYTNSLNRPCVEIQNTKWKIVKRFSFFTEKDRENYINEMRNREKSNLEWKEKRKIERKQRLEQLKKDLEIGTILVNSWGYEQTNVDSYIIIEKKWNSVKLQAISNEYIEAVSWMAANVKPNPKSYLDEILEKRISENMFKYWACDIWDGKKTYYKSWYA